MNILRNWWLPLLFVVIALFLMMPLLVIVVVSFTPGSFFRFPPGGISLRWYIEVLTDADWLWVFLASTAIAAFVAVTTTIASAMAVIALHGRRGRHMRWLVGSAAGLPLLLPHVSVGVAFFAMSARLGLPASYAVLALAHATLALPFAYRPILSSYESLDPALFDVASSLGARPAFSFWHVQLPSLRPGMVVAGIFTFMTSFEETTVSIFLTGPGVSTLPVRVLGQLQESASPAVAAVSTVMIVVTFMGLGLIAYVAGLGVFATQGHAR